MSAWLLAALLGVGPVLDPIAGEEMTARDRDLLPSGRHLASVADLWMVEVVSQQHNGAGIAAFDPVQLSAHGLSWTQMHFFIDGVDISDPARPGAPLVQVPYEAWTRVRFESLWSDAPGFHLELGDRATTHARARASFGGEVGGPLLLPDGFMDREPAFGKGVNPDRRALVGARELVVDGVAGGFRVLAEGIEHGRHYPTLVSPASGAAITDEGERASIMMAWRGRVGALPVDALVIGQLERRSHVGANERWPERYTLDGNARAVVAQAGTELHLPAERRLRLRLGWGYRADVEEPRTDRPIVSDIEGEWLWMARPRFAEELARMRFDGNAELDLAPKWRLSLRASQASVSSLPTIPGGRTATTWLRGASAPEPAGVAVTLYDPAKRAEEWLGNARLGLDGRWLWCGFDVRLHAALDWAAVGVPGETRLSLVSPAAGIAWVRSVGGVELFGLVRREPDTLTSEVSAFLDPARPSGNRYGWLDDGDRVPEPGEAGALLARTGGRYHRVAPDIVRPASNQLVLGVRSGRFGPFRAVLSTIGRLHTDRFTVVYNREVADSFSPVALSDPGGDGRGEDDADEVAYERTPGTEGQELYLLTNASRFDFYAGASAQLVTAVDDWWFLNLSAVGYWSIGGAPFGSFADRNDQGVIDEVSADPNARVSQRGRPDSDRSFGINLIAGVTPWQGFSAATAIRYRDGQPFVRMVVAEDLAQGPTPIMAVWRGAARHTFHMTVDARLRYRFAVGDLWVAAVLDGFNLLGSSVEILEDPRTGTEFRRPIEMVPGRSVMASVEVGWR